MSFGIASHSCNYPFNVSSVVDYHLIPGACFPAALHRLGQQSPGLLPARAVAWAHIHISTSLNWPSPLLDHHAGWH